MNETQLFQAYGVDMARLQDTEPEPSAQGKPMGTDKAQEGGGPRYVVRVRSFRTKLLDEDNLAGGSKFIIDVARPHLISEDSPRYTRFEWSQVKVENRGQEGTIFEIEELV